MSMIVDYQGYKLIPEEEYRVWELIKQHPQELAFILQEPDYEAYVSTFMGEEDPYYTVEDFDLIKAFLDKIIKE